MIIIGKDHKGRPISIVSASSVEAARAYWQGAGLLPHSEEIWDNEKIRENEKMGYVTPILKTQEIEITAWKGNEGKHLVIKS